MNCAAGGLNTHQALSYFKRYRNAQFLLKYKEICKDIDQNIFEGYSNLCYFNINSDFWRPASLPRTC